MIDRLDARDARLERGIVGLGVSQEAELRNAGPDDQHAPLSAERGADIGEEPSIVVRVVMNPGQPILGMTMCMILSRRVDGRLRDRVPAKSEDSRLVAVEPNHKV